MRNESSSTYSAEELKEAKEKQKSFLIKEIGAVEKALEPLKSTEADVLRGEADYKKERLEKNELSYFLLSSSAKEISNLKEKVETLITNQKWWSRIPTAAWFAIIPVLLVLYVAYLGFLQWRYQPEIHSFGTETAAAATQTQMASPTGTPTVTPIQIP